MSARYCIVNCRIERAHTKKREMSCVIIIKCCKSVKEKMSKFQLKSNKFRIKYAFVTRTMRHKINVSNAEDDNDVEAICSKVFFALQFFSFALFRRVRAFLINKNCKKEEKSGRNVNSLSSKAGWVHERERAPKSPLQDTLDKSNNMRVYEYVFTSLRSFNRIAQSKRQTIISMTRWVH